MRHREIHRIRDETFAAGLVVACRGGLEVVGGFDGDDGVQDHRTEVAAAAGGLDHRAHRLVGVVGDDDAVADGDVQVAQHVALAERGEQQLFGVPTVGVAVEGAVGGTVDRRFPGRRNVCSRP